eukprot:TRINITY_DN3766_c0_g1_i5.p1 TRINITY_DN3766_c0_g1~~TRINITY_DN3766_c0_g1_i5.p1  ORF type:complete len:204 (+),score=34.59 TRINITY_DN3766_c0_g1_i5:152-763(+)
MYRNDLTKLRTAFFQELLSKARRTEANCIAEAQVTDAPQVAIRNDNAHPAKSKAKPIIGAEEDAVPDIECTNDNNNSNEQVVNEASERGESPVKESIEENEHAANNDEQADNAECKEESYKESPISQKSKDEEIKEVTEEKAQDEIYQSFGEPNIPELNKNEAKDELEDSKQSEKNTAQVLSLIHICRCRRIERCRSRWSPYH